MNGKPITDNDREIVRREYGKRPTREIALELQRSVSSIYRIAYGVGAHACGRRFCWNHAAESRLRVLNAQGSTDKEIAGLFGCDRHAVSRRRVSLGLKDNSKGERWVEAIRRGVRRQLDRLGVAELNQLRTTSWAREAKRLGWPTTINGRTTNTRHLQILEVLYSCGPQTRESLAKAIGWTPGQDQRKLLASNGPGGSYLAELMRAGLVVQLGRCVGGRGKCKNVFLYMLAAGVEPKRSEEALDEKRNPD